MRDECRKYLRKEISLDHLIDKAQNNRYKRDYFIILECILNSKTIDNLTDAVAEIKYLFYRQKYIKNQFDRTLEKSIKNMILFNTRGRIKWSIRNNIDLEKVIVFFNNFFEGVNRKQIYNNIIQYYKPRIDNTEWILIKRINSVFPDLFADTFQKLETNLPALYYKIHDTNFLGRNAINLEYLSDEYLDTLSEFDLLRLLDIFEDTVSIDSVYTKNTSFNLIRRVQKHCKICKTYENLEVHHIHYLEKGGSNMPGNLIVLCSEHHRNVHRFDVNI